MSGRRGQNGGVAGRTQASWRGAGANAQRACPKGECGLGQRWGWGRSGKLLSEF